MLRETHAPLSEIALATGFSDQSHLARHFRRSGREPATIALVEDDPALAAALSSLASGAAGQEAAMARAETARLLLDEAALAADGNPDRMVRGWMKLS